MIDTLITALETVCPNNVYLQGSFEADAEYPESFITFWTNYTDDNAHYNDNVTSIDWQFSVIFYSSDPAIIQTKAATIRAALKAAGFIPQGRGNNIMSDRPSYTGWAMDFIKTEYL